MTDEERDDLLSRLFDGEGTAEDAAALSADPLLRADLDRYRSLGDRLAVSPPPAHVRDAMITRALDELSPSLSDDDETGTVPSLAARRRTPVGAWLAAAAVLVVAAIGVTSLPDRSEQHEFSVSEAADDAQPDDETGTTSSADTAGDIALQAAPLDTAESDLSASAESMDAEEEAEPEMAGSPESNKRFMWPPTLESCADTLDQLVPIDGEVEVIDDVTGTPVVEIRDPGTARETPSRRLEIDPETCETVDVTNIDR